MEELGIPLIIFYHSDKFAPVMLACLPLVALLFLVVVRSFANARADKKLFNGYEVDEQSGNVYPKIDN